MDLKIIFGTELYKTYEFILEQHENMGWDTKNPFKVLHTQLEIEYDLYEEGSFLDQILIMIKILALTTKGQ